MTGVLVSCQAPELAAWLYTNGINPVDVPIDARLVVETTADGKYVIRYEVYLRNDVGRKYVDPADPDRAAREPRTTPCVIDPPMAWCTPLETVEAT